MSKIKLNLRLISKEVEEKLQITRTVGSMKSLKTHLKNFSRDIFDKTTFDSQLFAKESSKVINHLKESQLAPDSITPRLNNLIKTLEAYGIESALIDPYRSYYDEIMLSKPLYVKKNPIKDKGLSWEDIEKLYSMVKLEVDNCKYYNEKIYKKFLVLSLYIHVPPLRPEDWLNCKIVDGSVTNEDNCLDLSSQKLYIYKSKTKNSIGSRIIDLPPVLVDIIKKWYLYRKTDYLFVKKNNKTMRSDGFSHYMSTNFKLQKTKEDEIVELTPNYLRNLFISEKIHDAKVPMEERHRLSKIMGHQLRTQEYVYSKYSKEKHPEPIVKEPSPVKKILIKKKKKIQVGDIVDAS